ncbi:MAG: prepilin-type cleavage/methylation domain-containing protein [Gallionellales bacterium 35-53-114]|nr:MAG: prepilin-type cleavage/methylation domain-containing protein [Gallionellales bacterium 35-53-114]OYZ65497.1 MAG: prepilin-type cleavage/methylation domain-containing protein [Gallionellales bacterium 24-53-125]OZB08254.1 MAG: prepilin-type cleavage/methylation domain-containing protein [Gallionellales bacterium 39-52-133]HQS58186.1 prepilin-type cleavage/methylation domain-containing protein [Gallionellaceae bacterium]HQS73741.1 prepilin-type cleavage/methylation domain-containing prote
MLNTHIPTHKSAQQGVVLLEAMIAILIFSFAVLGIVGLQAAMIKNTSESQYRAEASLVAQQKIGEMWSRPDPLLIAADLAEGTVNIPLLPGGTRTVVATGVPNEYLVTVTWQSPGEPQHNFTTIVTISGGVLGS